MTNNSKVRRDPEMIAVDMDGETVMMSIESGDYFGINAVGGHIWALLETEQTVQALLDSVNAHFDIKEDATLENDIVAFLDDLKQKKLVEIDPA